MNQMAYQAIADFIQKGDRDGANRALQQVMADSDAGMSDAFFWSRVMPQSTVERIVINHQRTVEGYWEGYNVAVIPNVDELSKATPNQDALLLVFASPMANTSDDGWHKPFVEDWVHESFLHGRVDIHAPYLDVTGNAATLMVFAEDDWHEAIIRTDGWHVPLGGGSEVLRADSDGELFAECLFHAKLPPVPPQSCRPFHA